ncbi:MAG: hypothetical protein KJN71_06890 [Acidimicrobiia bacterium]|nr:hypothetical protein [Acidimicrobiia bacterium]NNC74221.1 hypothetical protein [Acidimicrobiia bacterium]
MSIPDKDTDHKGRPLLGKMSVEFSGLERPRRWAIAIGMFLVVFIVIPATIAFFAFG